MINYDFDEYCCGCAACANICPNDAIKMTIHKDGFEYPKINVDKCINCGKCDKACPHLNAKNNKTTQNDNPPSWLYASNNDEAKMKSSSGAAFYEIAQLFIKNGNYVCGCVWDKDFNAKHILSNSETDLINMQGSKYLQSSMGNCYAQVLAQLKSGNKVLFSGTPCQCDAIHNLTAKQYRSNLYTVAVICHGVPSPGVWKSFKQWIEQKHDSALTAVNFRDKSQMGYKRSYCRYNFSSGAVAYLPTYLPSSKYMEASIVYNLSIRKSCSHCDCKDVTAACDLVIGDWYAEYKGRGSLGTSCITAFTDKGEKLAAQLSGKTRLGWAQILQRNSFVRDSVALNKNRDLFLNNIGVDMWDDVEKYYPPKYKYKKLLCSLGIFDILKRIIK